MSDADFSASTGPSEGRSSEHEVVVADALDRRFDDHQGLRHAFVSERLNDRAPIRAEELRSEEERQTIDESFA